MRPKRTVELSAHVRADRPRRLGLNNVCNVAILVA